ncbi:glycoside hydrolase family 43 protein [Paenibacillus sp. GYB003]|uniref:glycoside hydrolase family 43 protein n=1 Tax=Paenibacillus sp. GYB003 TaxID=2994392 RepID=UPI002F966C6E
MTLTLEQIHLRDPFILADAATSSYYMYGTTGKTAWGGRPEGFDVYRSDDLVHWEGPAPAFRPAPGFWADRDYWAPEVHAWNGTYYMFASFKAEGKCRATQILAADSPAGPFVVHSAEPVTPADWECLDGTLYVDEGGDPWIVFCHEWVQVGDGEICCRRLTRGLDAAVGDPLLLFKASESGWSERGKAGNRVTDGPFLFRSEAGELRMIWSSFDKRGYNVGVARSVSGLITGPWKHEPKPLFGPSEADDGRKPAAPAEGGHGMLFRTFDGRPMLVIHAPNKHPEERPAIVPVREIDGTLALGYDQ